MSSQHHTLNFKWLLLSSPFCTKTPFCIHIVVQM